MKRIVLAGIVTLGLMAAQTSFAQVQVGIRGGANWGFASKPEILDGLTSSLRPSAGPTGAIFLDVPLSEFVSFRPEVAYVQKGVMVREGFTFNAFNIPVTLGGKVAYQSHNVEVPLLFKFNMTNGSVQPYVILGPAVNYAVDGRVRTRGTGFLSTKPFDVDVNYGGMLSRWDVSAVGGLGLSMDAGVGKLFIEGRYTHGFTRQIQIPVININARNQGVAVSLGYSFPIGY
ncbi:porin family protein [Spirosoma soli]|uniref:Porin family protein n=1 Tax=Spirosoma soli TaxID=1770529 RepID=A0ABW5M2E3_9BACT